MKRRTTPQDKKALDYKKERRSHWDSDKAARKAIPASKAYRNRSVRRELGIVGSRALETANAGGVDEAGDLVTPGTLRSARRISKPLKVQLETLAEHVAHQQEQRRTTQPRAPHITHFFDFQRDFARPYEPGLGLEFKHRLRLMTRQRSEGSERSFWEQVQDIRNHLHSPFLRSFMAAEPTWKKRIESWISRLPS